MPKRIAIATILALVLGFSASVQAACQATTTEQIAETIARGHAFRKHVEGVDNAPGGREFERGRVVARLAFPEASIENPEQFAALLRRALEGPESEVIRRGRQKYWDRRSGTIVIVDPASRDCGTAFRPSGGRAYYDRLD